MKNNLENLHKPLIKINNLNPTRTEMISFAFDVELGAYGYIKRVLIENHCCCDFFDEYSGISVDIDGEDGNELYHFKIQVFSDRVNIGGETTHQLMLKRTYYEPDINLKLLIMLIYSIASFNYKGMPIEDIARHIRCEISDYEKHTGFEI